MTCEVITANLIGTVRTETLNGREHLVVPMTMIVPGVLNGSKGPLLYPAEEIAKTAGDWNGIPIVVYHPVKDGKPLSARQPSVYNSSYIGTIFNAEFNGKLVAEGWFDIERTRRVDPRVLSSLESGQPIELSTGLRTEEIATRGEFNGIAYNAIAKSYKPDHLAVLPDEIGACSLRDGCGVLVNTVRQVMNEKSFNDIRQSIETELMSNRFGPKDIVRYVVEVFKSYFILYWKNKMWRMNYKVENDVVTILDNTPVEVQLVTSYVPVTMNVEDDVMAKLTKAKREEIITDLIANCDCWEEDDRTMLEAMPDVKLNAASEQSLKLRQQQAVLNAAEKGFKAGNAEFRYDPEKGEFITNEVKPTEEETPPVTQNQEPPKPKTLNEWLAEAPAEVQDVVRNAQEREQREKDKAIEFIVANEKNVFTKEELQAMKLNQLEKLAALAVKDEQKAKPVHNYAGAAAATGGSASKDDVEEPLALPVMNWASE